MKNFLVIFTCAALLAGCSKVETQTVPVSPDRPVNEIVEEAAKADAKLIKTMVASYDAAIRECNRQINLVEKDIMKEKVTDINGETVKNLQDRKQKLAKDAAKLNNALEIYKKHLPTSTN